MWNSCVSFLEQKYILSNFCLVFFTAFAQLQTDVTDLTSDLEGTGMPFVSHRQYAMSMFFYGLEVQPATFDQEVRKEN